MGLLSRLPNPPAAYIIPWYCWLKSPIGRLVILTTVQCAPSSAGPFSMGDEGTKPCCLSTMGRHPSTLGNRYLDLPLPVDLSLQEPKDKTVLGWLGLDPHTVFGVPTPAGFPRRYGGGGWEDRLGLWKVLVPLKNRFSLVYSVVRRRSNNTRFPRPREPSALQGSRDE